MHLKCRNNTKFHVILQNVLKLDFEKVLCLIIAQLNDIRSTIATLVTELDKSEAARKQITAKYIRVLESNQKWQNKSAKIKTPFL